MEEKRIHAEVLSPFLKEKLDFLKTAFGEQSNEYLGLARQYLFDPREAEVDYKSERRRHYEADLEHDAEGHGLKGVERLYRRAVVLELTTACYARCRWCLRANYRPFNLKEKDVILAAKYFGNESNKDDLYEILITGGDPFIVPELLNLTIDLIQKSAPNIKIIRIGSRLPVQDPKRIFEDKLKNALRKREGLKIEVGTQVNNPIELFPESIEAYLFLQEKGIRIYNQQVLLKGVNDNLDTLVELYNKLRDIGIESHYMFHCAPIRGMSHHRTTIEEGLELIKGLTSSGRISGRSKPMYTAMTDIGKVTFYDGVILEKRGDMILLQTRYKKEDRLKWNPSWKMPESAEVDNEGYLRVWYKDSKIHTENWVSTYPFEE
jgi:lysine 2,3-aminomutase